MAAGCKAAIGCVDARVPVRASYVSLYKWPESDAEFVKSVAMARRHQGDQSPAAVPSYYNGSASMRRSGELFLPAAAGERHCSPRVVDSYSCRQMYLRSYTFSKKKETVPERTMACLGRVRERAAVFPFHPHRAGGSAAASDAGSVGSASNTDSASASGRKEQQARRKKRCAVARRLQEASCAIFRRLLACTTTVDVADIGDPSSAR
jgi:hypothetical protein